MMRRDLTTTADAGLLQAVAAPPPGAAASSDLCTVSEVPLNGPPADYALRVAPIALEITRGRFISTIGYNDASPGPVLRLREGRPFTVDVINDSDGPELVHWHGMLLPPNVDGAEEEGTIPVPPHARRRYRLVIRPSGTRWYHSHAVSMGELHRGMYTGQYGFVIVDAGNDPGNYDQELFLALREWDLFYTDRLVERDDEQMSAPEPERPARLDTRPNGLEPISRLLSINDRALHAGEPIRVRAGRRVLMHLLNAGVLANRTIALPGHEFHVLALDGNPVPRPSPAKVLTLGPGERIDAFVEMNHPGVWILGAIDEASRTAGLGVVIEYEHQRGQPVWIPPPANALWDYTAFGNPPTGRAPDCTIDLLFEKIPSGAGHLNAWTVNGKPYPHEREFLLQRGRRHRLVFRNRTADSHPLHLHRHSFELVDANGTATSGIMKDTVIVPRYGRVSIDLQADQPGDTLLHCQIPHRMDFGFKALFRYT